MNISFKIWNNQAVDIDMFYKYDNEIKPDEKILNFCIVKSTDYHKEFTILFTISRYVIFEFCKYNRREQ